MCLEAGTGHEFEAVQMRRVARAEAAVLSWETTYRVYPHEQGHRTGLFEARYLQQVCTGVTNSVEQARVI